MSGLTDEHLQQIRKKFPALARVDRGIPAVFLDGPAGTQVPQRVIDAMGSYLVECNANHGGLFPTSVESDRRLDLAHQALADFVNAADPAEIYFGQNMTSLTFALSRALAQRWEKGDEIIVTRLDHDANVTPWVMAARDAGANVRFVELNPSDCTLDLENLNRQLSHRTKLVAVGCASNSTGGINPVQQISRAAHEVGALVFLDAVHYGPHALIDVQAFEADFLACSAYKFFGPHVGIMWGKRKILEGIKPYKLRPAPSDLPGKWMTGTQSHEAILGAMAAVDYLADLGRTLAENPTLQRRSALASAFESIRSHERALCLQMLEGLSRIKPIKIWGIDNPERIDERFPTLSITHDTVPTTHLAAELATSGIFVWHGNYYALQLTETLGLEPEGMVRLGMVHYNTAAEVERCLEALAKL